MSEMAFQGLIDNLKATIKGLKPKTTRTEWGEYYTATNYSAEAFDQKKQLVLEIIKKAQPNQVWDIGANTGIFSRLASSQGIPTIAFDIDPLAIEHNYLQVIRSKEKNLLPLILDLTNPSPAIGWHNRERQSWIERGPADLALALALVHHLAISNNVPLPDIAEFFHDICHGLVIEFIPKTDSQVQRLFMSQQVSQDASGQQKVIRLCSFYIEKDGHVYNFHGISSNTDFNTFLPAFESTMKDFSTLTDASKLKVKPDRIRIKTVQQAGTLSEALAYYKVPKTDYEKVALLNNMDLNSKLEKGNPIKVISK